MSQPLQVKESARESVTFAPSRHAGAFLETASSLGAKVCRDALWANDRCNWIGPVMEPINGRWRQVHKVFGPEIYCGTSGVAWSLAALYTATGERMFKRTALAAIRHAIARAEDIEPFARIGLYSGWFGLALAAFEVAEYLDADDLRAPARRLVEELNSEKTDLTSLDLLAGCAGALVSLLALRQRFMPDDALVDFATRIGDHLLDTAVKDEIGWAWGDLHKPESGAFGNLNGYSHGAGGIGSALIELYQVTKDSRFLAAGNAAFSYERHWFDPETGNWPDLRDPELSGGSRDQRPTFMNAWCHGAPGIALSRLRAYELLGVATCRSEAETAINTTISNLYGNAEMSQSNYSLCHGLGGNCEPLIYGAKVLDRPDFFAKSEEVALRGIESYEAQQQTWPCGGPGNLESAGFMQGISGISYYYLRMADPETTPSLLILRPEATS